MQKPLDTGGSLYTDLFRIAKNAGYTVFIQGLMGLARTILVFVIARRFGPTDFGRLSLALSIVEIFKFVAGFGIDTVLIRQFSINKIPTNKLLSNSLILKLGTGTMGYVASLLFSWIFYSTTGVLNLLFILATMIYTTLLINVFVSYYQAELKMSEIMVSYVISGVVYVLLTLSGLFLNWSLFTLCIIMPASELLNVYIIHRIYKKTIRLSFSWDREIVLNLLREGFPVGLSGIMIIVYLRLDQLMLGWFKGGAAVGEYAAAFRVTEVFMIVFGSLSTSLYASFSGTGNSTSEGLRSVAFKVVGYTIALTLIVAAVLSFFAHDIMNLISKAYLRSADVLPILGWALVFKAVNTQLTAIINSKGLYTVITWVALAILVINVSLNLLLIPAYGILGAASAVLLTEATNTIIQSSYVIALLRPVRTLEVQQ
jgi:O-antigen/teichoic acid export membrane protein